MDTRRRQYMWPICVGSPKEQSKDTGRNSMVLTCIHYLSVAAINNTMTKSNFRKESLFGLRFQMGSIMAGYMITGS